MIKALVVDDQAEAREYLLDLLKELPDVTPVAQASGVTEAMLAATEHKPDLIFLDVELGHETGFEFLNVIRNSGLNPSIIFVTGYEKYAIEAIRHAALDYLLKPVGLPELKAAVDRYRPGGMDELKSRFDVLFSHLKENRKVLFCTRSVSIYLNIDEIYFCEADGNYTKIYLPGNKTEYVSSQIGQVFSRLAGKHFLRLGRSYVVNLQNLSRIERQKKIIHFESNGHSTSLKLSVRLIKELTYYLEGEN
jgi:two-component system LytT family response regulator